MKTSDTKVTNALFRPAPFWFLNHKLNQQNLEWQITHMAEMGLGGAVLHSRHGLLTPYLSDEWFRMLEYAIRCGERYGLSFWLYDEDNYPSGPAGTRTWEGHPEFIMRYLYQHGFYRLSPGEVLNLELPEATEVILTSPLDVSGNPEQFPYLVRELPLPSDHVLHFECPEGRQPYVLYVYATTNVSPGLEFYDRKYLDVLNPMAVRRFIEVTHEEYFRRLGGAFGKSVLGIFMDEPATFYGDPAKDIQYTPALWDEFERRKGYDLKPCLPTLFASLGSDGRRIRIDFYDVVSQLYAENFFAQIYKWCEDHGLQSIGHMLEEGEVQTQVKYQIDFFRNTRWMHRSGVDHLGHGDAYRRSWLYNLLLGPKFASSAAHLLGKGVVCSEAFGEVGWTYNLADLKRLFDSQLALGVNYIIPHAFYYSIQGFRKGECPPDESWRVPFCEKHYKKFSDYISNACYSFTDGQHLGQIGVVIPYRSWWAEIVPGRMERLKQMDGSLAEIAEFLTRGGYDWDLMNEELLEAGDIGNGLIYVGPNNTREGFKVIILPDARELSNSTIPKLNEFITAGGKLILLGCASEVIEAFQGHQNVYTPESLDYPLLWELLPSPNVRLDPTAQGKDLLLYSYKKNGILRYFIFNDSHESMAFVIWLSQHGPVYRRDLETKECYEIQIETDGSLKLNLEGYESILLEQVPPMTALEEVKTISFSIHEKDSFKTYQFNDQWEISINRDNALVLSDWQATFKVSGGTEEGLCGWHRYAHVFRTQFYVKDLPGRCRLLIDGLIHEHVIGLVEKDLELRINDQKVQGFIPSDYLDEMMYVTNIISSLRHGVNIIEVICREPFYEGLCLTDPMILLGNFTVIDGKITALPSTLHSGNWVDQGFPHFAGSINYSQSIRLPETLACIVDFPSVADTVEIIVNGKRAGSVCWPPWRLDVSNFISAGENEFIFTVTNGLANLVALRARPAGLIQTPVLKLVERERL